MRRLDRIREYAKRTPAFDTRSIVRLAGDKDYAYLLLSRLLKAGQIKRITRGYYTVYEEPSLIVYCLKPAYLGLQDAMSFHNLWEQETNPVVLTVRRVRPGARKVLGSNVIVRRISSRHFFGYDHVRQGELFLPVSDIEKTFIDMVYFREMRKDMIGAFRGKINKEKLSEYLKRYDKRFADKVTGLLESYRLGGHGAR